MNFETWMNRVDNRLVSLVGVTSADLPDQCYYDYWEDGISPTAAATDFVNLMFEEMGFDAYLIVDYS